MKNKSVKRWRRLTVFLGALLVIAVTLYNVANIKFSAIRSFLGGETSKIVKGDAGEEDTEYFKKKYAGGDALKEYLSDVCRKLEQEGIVLLQRRGRRAGAAA